jgi:hypothetical protein
MSDGVSVFGELEGDDSRGMDRADKDRRGATSSGGPSSRLEASALGPVLSCRKKSKSSSPLRLRKHFWFLQGKTGITNDQFTHLLHFAERILCFEWRVPLLYG